MMMQKNNKIKIAISVIVNAFESDGTTIRAIRILRILKNHYNLSLITRANEMQELKGLEDVKVIIAKPDKTKMWNLKLIPIMIKNKFDIVYCSNDWFGFLTYYLLSKIYKYKIIFEAHSILSEESKEKSHSKIRVMLNQIFERFIIKHADYVIALSENTLKFYINYTKNIELIPVFIDMNLFKVTNEIKAEKRKRIKKIIGLIGPFDSTFNTYFLDFLYTNIKLFDEKIEFLIIGRCNNKIKNEKITYTGYLDSLNDYVEVLSSLDAVLIPSKIATYGPLNKIIEPMSCSLPVFTTPKGVVGLYYVEHGKDILVFEDNIIIDKINELIFDEESMGTIGENARATVEKYYSKQVNEQRLIQIIENFNAIK